jgi:CheY-like chemotaxis protein
VRRLNRTLPDTPAEQCQTAEGEPTVRQLCEKPGVLVVDDDHLVRIMVQLGLERNGFEVWLASNGQEAFRLYRKHRQNIAVVLLDVRMRGLDGPQTVEALRKVNPEVRVCFMSCNPGTYHPEELLQRYGAYVVTKPFYLDQLANVLRLLANGVPASLLQSCADGGGRQAGRSPPQ